MTVKHWAREPKIGLDLGGKASARLWLDAGQYWFDTWRLWMFGCICICERYL